jgi:hypothetical protein
MFNVPASSDWEELQLAALKHEIAVRLRMVCEHMPEERFDALIDRMATLQRKYEQQRNRELFHEAKWKSPTARP